MKLDELNEGDIIIADDGFSCLQAGEHEVFMCDGVPHVHCDEGTHALDGQVDARNGQIIGFTKK